MANVVLESLLKPLEEFYTPSFVEEIAINHAGQVWMRLHGARVPWVAYSAPQLTKDYLINLIYTVANVYKQPFDPEKGSPTVYIDLPGQRRFSAIAGKNVRYDDRDLTGGVAMNIRSGIVKETSLKNYHLEHGKPLMKMKERKKVHQSDPYDRLMQAVNDGSPILISGATATGKTTILNHLLTLIDKDARVITVEDNREINVPQPNHVHLLLSRTEQTNSFDYVAAIDLTNRMTPDIVLGGEIATNNAAALWNLLQSGNNHFYTTIHANSAEEAYRRFAELVLGIQSSANKETLIQEMKETICVVQLARDGGDRAIIDVVHNIRT